MTFFRAGAICHDHLFHDDISNRGQDDVHDGIADKEWDRYVSGEFFLVYPSFLFSIKKRKSS